MKTKRILLSLIALSASATSFAAPVSTPNSISDTPIVSSVAISNIERCQAYTTSGSTVDLSTVSRVTFYGGGSYGNRGGYLSAGIAQQSGTGVIQKIGGDGTYAGTYAIWKKYRYCSFFHCRHVWAPSYYPRYNTGTGVGLFLGNTTSQSAFIAGAGGGGASFYTSSTSIYDNGWWIIGGDGGGWTGGGSYAGTIYGGTWFALNGGAGVGFYNGSSYGYGIYNYAGGGGASSISAFYNIPTNGYTSPGSTVSITAGGLPSSGTATAYVCK